MKLKDFFGITTLALAFVLSWCLGVNFELLDLLLALGKFIFKFELAAFGIIQLMLEHGLFALHLLLMLLDQDQLFILHVFKLVFKIAKLSLFIFHLFTGIS